MLNGLWLAVLGVLGASSLIIARRPDAKELIGKIAPYQGWIGAISAFWGAWGVISAVLRVNLLGSFPIYWATFLASSALLLGLGLILGIGVLKTFIKNQEATRRMNQALEQLLPYQGTLGVVAIGVGCWTIVSTFLWHVS